MIYLGNQAVGVAVDGKCGNFTKYERKTLTFPNATNANSYPSGATIKCSFIPKFVTFNGGTDTSGNIVAGAYLFSEDSVNNTGYGGTYYRNSANGTLTTSGVVTRYNTNSLPAASANACRFFEDEMNIYITRVSSNGYWSNTDSYTFEIYG